jgi:lysine-N-methylase
MTAPIRHVALRYMDGFHCIGPDCEDNCCRLWSIVVDQSTHQKLKKAMSADPVDAARFQQTFSLVSLTKRSRIRFAEIPAAESGPCPMLDGVGLCSIHAKYGEPLLPSICASYPRRVTVVGSRMELSGDLSCPEVARRALLVDGSADLMEVAPEVIGEPRLKRSFDPATATPYDALLDEIRGTLHQLLSLGAYPLRSRLYFAVTLAEHISGFFNAGAVDIDEERLAHEFGAIDTPELRDALHERFRALTGEGPMATSLLAQALAARLLYDRVPRMLKLVDTVFEEYAAAGGGVRTDEEGGWTLWPEPLWEAYRARRDALEAAHPERMERWFRNYCQHYFVHEWYMDSPTLLSYLQTMMLKLAMLRFLLVGHPMVREALALPEAEAGPILDRALIEVSYTLSRSIEHGPAFLDALNRVFADNMAGSAATIALLKL